jgi:hypothetical protein
MKKVIPFFKTFTTIFYLKKFELGKVVYGLVKVCMDLNLFESV